MSVENEFMSELKQLLEKYDAQIDSNESLEIRISCEYFYLKDYGYVLNKDSELEE